MIVAIASGLAAPGIQSGWRAREVRHGHALARGVMRGLRERAVRRGVEQELVIRADGQTFSWSDGQEATLPGGAADHRPSAAAGAIRTGGCAWSSTRTAARAALRSSSRQHDGDSLSFALRVDPMLGSVVIQDAST